MNLLDENVPESQRRLLESKRVSVRQNIPANVVSQKELLTGARPDRILPFGYLT
jgi:hypothetical protein